MEKITVELENCYGIKNLVQDFDFQGGKPFSIYAPNGYMKTSFSRTLLDVQKGRESKDEVFPERVTRRKVWSDGAPLESGQVFVIEPYSSAYESENVSTLLVNKEIRGAYESAVKDVEDRFSEIVRSLKNYQE